MTWIKNYNKTLHDIYIFDGDPVFNRSAPPGVGSSVRPLRLNPSNLLKNPNYNYAFSDIDWSGLEVRDRGFIQYGWDVEYLPNCNSNYGSFCLPNSMYPDAVRQFSDENINNAPIIECYDVGCPEGNFNEVNNYNRWNNGAWAGAVISPEHAIACTHYTGSVAGVNLTKTWRFLGKNGTFYTKTSKARAYAGRSVQSDVPSLIPLGIDMDFTLYKFDEPLTAEEQQQITIYPIVKPETLIPGTKVYLQDPNGKLLISKVESFYTDLLLNLQGEYIATILPGLAYELKETDIPLTISYEDIPQRSPTALLTVGDSGTPALVYLENKTCFLGLLHGGIFAGQQVFREVLAEFIKNDTINSYEIQFIDGGYTPGEGSGNNDGVTNLINNPLKQFPYNSEFASNFDTLTHINVGFFNQSRVYCQELNKIEEMFLNQQSKTIEMISNYFGNRLTNDSTTKAPITLNKTILDLYGSIDDTRVSTITPLYQNQISKNVGNQIVINRGWYFIKAKLKFLVGTIQTENDIKNYDIYKWFYNKNEIIIDPLPNKYGYLNLATFNLKYPENESGETDINDFIKLDFDYLSNNLLILSDIPNSNSTELKPLIFYTDSNGVSYLANGTLIR